MPNNYEFWRTIAENERRRAAALPVGVDRAEAIGCARDILASCRRSRESLNRGVE